MYLFYHNLRLIGHPSTQGRFFTNRFITSHAGDYLAIEEYDTDGTTDSFDRIDVRLIIISIERAEEAIVSHQVHGGIRPARFEAGKIIYDKWCLTQNGVIHHFERAITDLDWRPLK